MSNSNFQYIDNDNSLKQYIDSFKKQEFITIDTEFVREYSYYPKLALMQIADKDNIVLIDPLTINNLEPLSKILFDTNITKVFHASRQDLEIFYYLYDSIPSPVFDTQIAASLLGIGEQVSYAGLINTLLNKDIDKSQTRTNWLKRPLNQNQLEYAANDVAYLYQAYPLLRDQLSSKGRLDWLEPDFKELCSNDTYIVDTDNVWKKVKGFNALKNNELVYLSELAKWRENEAIKQDKPRRRVISDTILIELARMQPETVEALASLREISPKNVAQYGQSILACIKNATLIPASERPSIPRRKKPSAKQAAMVDILMSILKITADQSNITPSILANRKDIEKMVSGDRDIPLLHGWRYEHAGKQLDDFLAGKITLYSRDGNLLLDYQL